MSVRIVDLLESIEINHGNDGGEPDLSRCTRAVSKALRFPRPVKASVEAAFAGSCSAISCALMRINEIDFWRFNVTPVHFRHHYTDKLPMGA